MTDTIMLKVRLVDKKVFKKFQFYPKKTVREARIFIAKELMVDPEQYGLFLPPKDDQNGIWFRDDYPLDFYGLEGETDQKESLLFSSKESPMMEFVEFKKRYRPIKVAKEDSQYKTVMVDDTMNVSEAIQHILTHVPPAAAISEDQLLAMGEDEVEVLSGDMTIREQGYVGECTTGLLKNSKGKIDLFVKVPYCEGWLMRKRGGGLIKGLKNWNKRWYALKKNRLLYYKGKNVGSEMGCIYMKTVQTVRPARDGIDDIPSKYSKMCFEILTPGRTFVMLANSVSEMKKWIEILEFSRRMFAYETHFFGISSKKLPDIPTGRSMSVVAKGDHSDGESEGGASDSEGSTSNGKAASKAAEMAAAEKQKQEEQLLLLKQKQEEEERIQKEKEEQERIQKEKEEEERKRVEEEKRQEEIRKIKEEEELLQKQHQEFLEKQQQLELEKQKQLQDQMDEDRRLEELMIQMEMDQEERIRIREEQERLEQEKLELAKKLQEEEERLEQEKQRIKLEQERIEQERVEKERVRQEQERIEKERIERQEQERIEKERIRQEQERIERQRAEEVRLEQEKIAEEKRLEEERLEQERIEQERLEQEEIDILDQLQKEEEEAEREHLASKRLRSMQARLDGVEAETPELKFLLSEISISSPESLLIAWANYMTAGSAILSYSASAQNGNGVYKGTAVHHQNGSSSTSSPVLHKALQASSAELHSISQQPQPIRDLKSVEANLELYSHLLYKLEPGEIDISQFLSKTTILEKAEFIQAALEKLGIMSIQTAQLLSPDPETHLNILLTIYEEVGGNWQEDFQTQVVSKRMFSTKYISRELAPLAAQLGIQIPESPYDLLPSLLDGVVLCHLINKIYPGTIDERCIKTGKSAETIKNNLFIAINASKSLGANHDISCNDVGSLSPTDLHNLVWAITEVCLLQSTDPSKNRHLFHLLRAETRNAFRALEREKIMLRWFNYHLRKNTTRSINNFTDDMEDCENYAYLFDQIAPQVSRKDEILRESDWEKRAEIVIQMASKIGCTPVLTPRDIVETENSKLNMLFVADIMRVCHGLPPYLLRIEDQLDDQVAKSREQGNNDTELLQWINQLGLGLEAEVTNLLEDFKSGLVFLKIFDKVTPAGTVDPKKLKINPTSVFKMVELCNYTMEICHKLKLNVAGIAGTDLMNGNLRANRAILNQIRRFTGEKQTIDTVTAHQSEGLKWANSKVVNDKVKRIQSFKDQFLQDGLFLLELLSSLSPNLITRQNITPGSNEEEQEKNARYFVTSAWSIGIPLVVGWEDVSKVRSKSIKHIIETLQSWDQTRA
eukprot:gene8651-10649_t